MRNEAGRHLYSLVHASRSSHGFKAMKEAVSDGLRNADLPERVRDRIRRDLSLPIEAVVDDLRGRFNGRDALWVDDIKKYLLHSTKIFPFQFEELKQTLEKDERVIRREGKKINYFFIPRQDSTG